MFSSLLGPKARKFLKKCERDLYARLMKRIEELEHNPFPTDVKRVQGRDVKTFRVRVGDYRIKYLVYYETSEILVFEIDKREDAY